MANVPVTANQFDAGVYQIETNDPVVGGAAGISNKQAIALANRTAFLKAAVDAVIAGEGGTPDNIDPTLLYSAIQAAVAAGATPLPTVVTQVAAEAGVSTIARLWTAERVSQAIAALVSLRAQSTTAQAQAGVNTTTDMSPARVAEAIAALGSKGLGDGQTRQSLLATRFVNVGYVNSGTRAIFLSVCFSHASINASWNLHINNVDKGRSLVYSGGGGTRLGVVILSNETYEIVTSNCSIVSWDEIR